jgi:hypothetical protein
MRKRNIFFIILLVLVLIIIGIRLYLPYYVRDRINDEIAAMEGFHGGVDRVSMQLFRGAIQVYDLMIFDELANDPNKPFVSLYKGDVSISLKALIKRGEVIVEILLDSPVVNFTLRDTKEEEEQVIDLQKILEELVPFRIDLFEIRDAIISYRDVTTTPQVEIYFSDFNVQVSNIQNIDEFNDSLPAHLSLRSSFMHTGSIILEAGANLLTSIPDFEYTLEVEDLDMTKFNEFFEAYAYFNLNNGELNVYSEAASREGFMVGYVKPIIEELEITPTDDDAGTLKKVYEGVLEVLTDILENPDTDRIGTELEFEGQINDPEVGVWPAVWALLRNAFLESITKGVDHKIDFDQLN